MSDGAITITLPADLDADVRAQVLEALPEAGVAVEEAAPPPPPDFADALDAGVGAFTGFPAAIGRWSERWAEQGMAPLTALLITLGCLALVYAGEYALRRLLRGEPPAGRAGFTAKLTRAAKWFALRLVALGAFWLAAVALTRAALPDHAAPMADLAIGVVLFWRAVFAVIEALAAPGAPWRRLPALSDEDADMIMRRALILFVVGGALNFGWAMVELARAEYAGSLVAAILALAAGAAVAAFFIAVRRPIRGLILRAFDEKDGALRRFAADYWHLVYAAIAGINALAQATAALGVALGQSLGGSVQGSLLVVVLTPFALAGISAWRDERLADSEGARHGVLLGVSALAKGLLVVSVAIFVLNAWGLDPFDDEPASAAGRIVGGVVEAGFALVVAFALWRAISDMIDVWAPQKPPAEEGVPEEMGGAGGTRLETVAPILRGAAFSAITVGTLMVALSSLGVNIAPLIAGAGVLGLAIGFGAQKLVTDVINGVFYLYEDAFRIGEYIESSGGKGVVEQISLRSARLRHPRGALYTVPFSDMGTIQNHSRDWVKVKFTFEVPQDTDLERIRKLVKKAGAAMLDDPELEGKIIDQMKSQGAVGIAGRAWQIGVKFVTRPGDQFITRRKAMAALQKAFEENGIELMTPRITFDAAQDAQGIAQAFAAGSGLER